MYEVNFDEDRSAEAIAFLNEIADVCRKHRMSLSHEDAQGGFIVQPFDLNSDLDLLMAADEHVYDR